MTTTHRVEGGGGLALHVEETGNPQGPPILFIHGFSQCGLCWRKQTTSWLRDGHRLVVMDIRGHGRSEAPSEVYGDSALWADDIKAVIETLGLDRPVLSGWSYGGVILCDYIRHHGTEAVRGVHLVSAVTKLGKTAVPFLGQDFVNLFPGFFSDSVGKMAPALLRFLNLCVAAEPSPEDLYLALGYNTMVPPTVRKALFSRTLDNDDLLPQINVPALVTHGGADAVVLAPMAEHNARLLPRATVAIHAGIGHCPFWEDSERFNRDLAYFVAGIT